MVHSVESGALAELLDAGWAYHDTESVRLACQLEAVPEEGVTPDVLASFLLLSTHTMGEHLGDWERALRLGKRVLGSRTPGPETARAWGRLYVTAILAGHSIEAAGFELSYLNAVGGDFDVALLDMRFMLVGALVGAKRAGEAATLYRSALDLVWHVRQSTLLDQTIASASNNLGWELYEKSARAAAENTLMRLCAETSLTTWLKCGNWINAERGHYLNALVANVAGDPASALVHADTALAIIAANGERPLDAALLHLARATSLAALGDADGRAEAIGNADSLASGLSAPGLKAQYEAERIKEVASLP